MARRVRGFPPPPYPGWFEKSKGEAASCEPSPSGDSRAPSMSSFATSDVDWMPCTLSLNSFGLLERRIASSSVMRPVLYSWKSDCIENKEKTKYIHDAIK